MHTLKNGNGNLFGVSSYFSWLFNYGLPGFLWLGSLTPALSQGTTTLTYTAAGSQIFNVPAGINTVTVECWGGGGGGGGNTMTSFGGGGGGGGAYSRSTLTVIPLAALNLTVGVAGTGGNGSDGSSGGDSWFGSTGTILAKGGSPGLAPVSGAGVRGLGGNSAAGLGTFKFSGGNGGNGGGGAIAGGGGGGSSAGTGSAGNAGGDGTTSGGVSGVSVTGGGIGATGGNSSQNGLIGGLPGGGGGGSGDKTSPNLSGGSGGTGKVIITYTQPTAAITYNDGDAIVSPGQSLIITATFSEVVADAPIMRLSLSGANTLALTNMDKTSSTVYTYTHTVGAGSGAVTVAMGTGTNLAGNIVVSAPTSGATFTVVPALSIGQLSTGIAPSPLAAGTNGLALLGFSLASSGTQTVTGFNFSLSSNPSGKLLNFSLVRSTDNSFTTTGDNVAVTGTVNVTASAVQVNSTSEGQSSTAKNYFLVADVNASVGGGTAAVQPSFGPSDITVSTGSVSGSTISGTNYAFVPSEPTIQTSNIVVTELTTYGVSVNLAPGNGTDQILVVKQGAPVDVFPADGVTYSASFEYGSGSDLGNGNYVVAVGGGSWNSWGFNGLSQNAVYYLRIFQANGTNYLTTPDNSINFTTPPLVALNSFSPTSGPIGTSLSINGGVFVDFPTTNNVYFGGSKATVTQAAPNQLTVTVPTTAINQPFYAIMQGLIGYSSAPFRVTFPFSGEISASFSNKVKLTMPDSRYAVIGDLDGDGKLDIAAADIGSGLVSVFRNTSSLGTIVEASFQPRLDFAAGSLPFSLALGDLDRDGKLDMVVTNLGAANTVSVFRNTSTLGAISFAARESFTTAANATYVTIGDLDGDGKPDIAVACADAAVISVLKNVSFVGQITSSSFQSKQDFPALGSWSMALSDIDGDGKLDMVATGDSHVTILRNTSKPGTINTISSFAPKVDFTTGASAAGIYSADLDQDGKPDIIVGNSGANTISIFRNISTSGIINSGSLDTKFDITTPSPWSIGSGDLDGDGKLDIIARNSPNVSVFRNNHSGGPFNATSFSSPIIIASTGTAMGISVGDIDGDGLTDLVTGNEGTVGVDIFRNQNLQAEPVAQPTALTFSSVAATSFSGDFTAASPTADGYLVLMSPNVPPNTDPVDGTAYTQNQILGVNAGNNIYAVFSGTGTSFGLSGITPGEHLYFKIYAYNGSGSSINYLTIGPLTGDQATTLATPTITNFNPPSGPTGTTVTITGTNFSTTAASNIVYFGATKATVTASTETQLTVTVPAGATYHQITTTVAGLTAYSAAPFIVTFPGGGLIGSNSFTTKVDFTAGTNPHSVAIGDLDGDGKADLAVANETSNTVSIFRNASATGSITSSSFNAKVDFGTGTQPRFVAISDLDGDGKPELSVTNYGSNTLSVFRNTTTTGAFTAGSFASRVDFTTGIGPYGIAIADLDGDGKPDLALANTGGPVSIFKNTSTPGEITTSSFAPRVDFTAGTTPYIVAIGDLDMDGKPDLAVANAFSISVSVFKNTTAIGAISASSFASKVDFTTGTGPYDVAIGDLDGDGKPELAVANFGANSVSVFKNTSVAAAITVSSFAGKVDFATGSGPHGIAIADLDGDGKPDLAVTNSNSATVSVFKNTTDPGPITASSFSVKVDFATGVIVRLLAVGDLDGDGKPDLVACNESNSTISILRNRISEPSISVFNPLNGPVGTSVTIDGTNFSTTPLNNIVKFNGTAATITGTPTPTRIIATVPTGATTGKITVEVGGQTGTSANDFTVSSATAPTLTGFNPTNGPIGATVTLIGTNFDTTPANNTVKFNTITATVTASTVTSITTSVPAGATTGKITVTVAAETATSTSDFTVSSASAPTLTGFNPAGGPVGTGVTLTGTNFSTTPANNTVLFNSVAATVTSSTATSISTSVPTGATTGKITVMVGGLTATSANDFVVGSDVTSPIVADNTSPTVAAGANISITATITDAESAITSGSVEFRSISAGGNTTMRALTSSGSTYSVQILTTEIGELGIEYRITATSAGGTTTDPSWKTIKIALNNGGNGLAILYSSFGKEESNYRIIAVPLDLTSKTVNDVFDELGPYGDKIKWRMYRYDNGSTSELSGSVQIEAGKGYWLIIKENPGALNSGVGNTVQATSNTPFEIDLKADWNQIGNPYNFNLSWADVQAANPGLPGLRKYNGDFVDGTRLDKLEGGFVKVTSQQKLKFPVVKNASVNSGRSKEETKPFLNSLDQPNWRVYFTLQQGNFFNHISGFGMNEKARDGFDVYDGFNLPHFFEVFLNVNHNKKEGADYYSSDMVPPSENHIWEFSVESNLDEPLMTLSWDNSYFGSNDRELYLWDNSLQRSISMRDLNSYSFDRSVSGSFKVIFGSNGFVREKTSLNTLVFHSVTPNPSAGDVAISFTLPGVDRDYQALVEVVDLLGRKVWMADGKMSSGFREVTWHRSDKENTGIYVVRIQAAGMSGSKRLVLK